MSSFRKFYSQKRIKRRAAGLVGGPNFVLMPLFKLFNSERIALERSRGPDAKYGAKFDEFIKITYLHEYFFVKVAVSATFYNPTPTFIISEATILRR